MVTLRNTQNRRQSFELPHEFVCSEGECHCTVVDRRGRTLDPATGEVGTTSEEVRVPYAVHIAARGTTAALPDGVLDVPAVAAAINRGLLKAD
jgi:hypothetical protein